MTDTTAHAPEPASTEEGVPHPYHLVNPSPWPLVGALGGGVMAAGAVWFMHEGVWWLLVVGLLIVLFTMFMWWRDVLDESIRQKAHTAVTKIGLRYGMILFIASEVMFFVAFFWAYFDPALFPADVDQFGRMDYTGGIWPPEGFTVVDPFYYPLLMTMILLLSGTTVTWAHHAVVQGNNKEAAQALGITVFLGLFFVLIQAYEYTIIPFSFREGVMPSTFYMATGFHGFHVIIGTIFLAVCWWRAGRRQFKKDAHVGFESAAWYWHFVDVVWLFLFGAVYWWGFGDGHFAPH